MRVHTLGSWVLVQPHTVSCHFYTYGVNGHAFPGRATFISIWLMVSSSCSNKIWETSHQLPSGVAILHLEQCGPDISDHLTDNPVTSLHSKFHAWLPLMVKYSGSASSEATVFLFIYLFFCATKTIMGTTWLLHEYTYLLWMNNQDYENQHSLVGRASCCNMKVVNLSLTNFFFG